MRQDPYFESRLLPSFGPAFVVLILMWLVYWADYIFPTDFQRYGLVALDQKGLRGIVLMPWIHAHSDIKHILNNSLPTFLLLGLLFYSYKTVAWRVFLLSWFFTGVLLWLIGGSNGAVHIGMSGVIYALAGFLFASGVLRGYLPLQALSLFIIFLYGSMIWGVFPTQPRVSWQGHLSGLIVGVILAFIYRKQGPQRPKYQYEIEKELGIEPPDFEGDLRRAIEAERLAELEAMALADDQAKSTTQQSPTIVVYDYKKND
jgi:membrane associated rhomboid family serine protease